MEVVDIKKILVPNLLIYIYLHCVRSSRWCATMLATLIFNFVSLSWKLDNPYYHNRYWCSTKVDDKLQHIGGGGHWAYCSQSCPPILPESRGSLLPTIIETTSPTTRTSAIITTSATTTLATITSETATSQPTSLRILRS